MPYDRLSMIVPFPQYGNEYDIYTSNKTTTELITDRAVHDYQGINAESIYYPCIFSSGLFLGNRVAYLMCIASTFLVH